MTLECTISFDYEADGTIVVETRITPAGIHAIQSGRDLAGMAGDDVAALIRACVVSSRKAADGDS